ncbi:MAG: LysR family transcriptional regulator [Clostridiales bacterium]|nr:LysR family transcriptional regulator [Clostridiales bacterium]
METKYIQEFLVLAEMESSYAAAEKLFVSQSTLVRHIQGIEDEFGVPLFNRSKRGFVLNDAGRIFVDCAKKIALTQD